MILFAVVIALAVVAGLAHVYLWKRLIRDTTRPGWGRRVGGIIMILLAGLIPVTLAAENVAWIAWPGFLWLAFMFYLSAVLAVLELPMVAAKLWLRRRARSASRTATCATPAGATGPTVFTVTAPAATGGQQTEELARVGSVHEADHRVSSTVANDGTPTPPSVAGDAARSPDAEPAEIGVATGATKENTQSAQPPPPNPPPVLPPRPAAQTCRTRIVGCCLRAGQRSSPASRPAPASGTECAPR